MKHPSVTINNPSNILYSDKVIQQLTDARDMQNILFIFVHFQYSLRLVETIESRVWCMAR